MEIGEEDLKHLEIMRAKDGVMAFSLDPSKAKGEFFAQVDKFVKRTEDPDLFFRLTGFGRGTAGCGQGKVEDVAGHRILVDPRVAVFLPAFRVDNQDYSDLVPLVELHEKRELWYRVMPGSKLLDPGLSEAGAICEVRDQLHLQALGDEFREAFKLGKAERLLEFLVKTAGLWSRRPEADIKQDQEMYDKIKT